MTFRFSLLAAMAFMQTTIHVLLYGLYYTLYQTLCVVETACKIIDEYVESCSTIKPFQQTSSCAVIPWHVRFTQGVLRCIWRFIMKVIFLVYTLHESVCLQTWHALPNDVEGLIYYFWDHPSGPCADYCIN